METDKFGRSRTSTSSTAVAAAINMENIRIHSKIQEIREKFEKKNTWTNLKLYQKILTFESEILLLIPGLVGRMLQIFLLLKIV